MILSLFIVFLLFGMLLPFGFIMADSDDDKDNSGSGNGDDNGNGNSDNDDDEKKDDDRSGKRNRERLERKVEIKDGKTKIEIKRRFIDADGNEVKEIVKIVIEEDENGNIIRKFKI